MENRNRNTSGLKPPWKPGESGNPAGYSRNRRLTDAIKRKLSEPGREDQLADAWFDQALNGSYPHLREILDRTEGKVANKVEMTETKIDWAKIDNECDTERPAASATGPKPLPESGKA